ncbi:MAG TPA: hypothetical protein VLL51_09180 [Gemmatimonadales bacterium]|nr:hypothetical protein [Gemmatimonadales bacterium]
MALRILCALGDTMRAEVEFQAAWPTGDFYRLSFNWHLNRECDLIRNHPAVSAVTRVQDQP